MDDRKREESESRNMLRVLGMLGDPSIKYHWTANN